MLACDLIVMSAYRDEAKERGTLQSFVTLDVSVKNLRCGDGPREIILAVVAGCCFATSAATIILVFGCNEILRASDAAIDPRDIRFAKVYQTARKFLAG